MRHPLKIAFTLLLITMMLSCSDKNHKEDPSKNNVAADQNGLWLSYSKKATTFKLWSPNAEQVKLNLFKKGKSNF